MGREKKRKFWTVQNGLQRPQNDGGEHTEKRTRKKKTTNRVEQRKRGGVQEEDAWEGEAGQEPGCSDKK